MLGTVHCAPSLVSSLITACLEERILKRACAHTPHVHFRLAPRPRSSGYYTCGIAAYTPGFSGLSVFFSFYDRCITSPHFWHAAQHNLLGLFIVCIALTRRKLFLARQEMQEEQYRYNKNPFSLQKEVRRLDSMYTCIQMCQNHTFSNLIPLPNATLEQL